MQLGAIPKDYLVLGRRLELPTAERFMPGFMASLICHFHFHHQAAGKGETKTIAVSALPAQTQQAVAMFAQREGTINLAGLAAAWFKMDRAHRSLDVFVWGPKAAVAIAVPEIRDGGAGGSAAGQLSVSGRCW